ncbi:hypothetical protein HHE06_14660 [Helicobacter heilmannii]|nr:hypothetical protein HHE06_14660 [Helicobacter heilmannii]
MGVGPGVKSKVCVGFKCPLFVLGSAKRQYNINLRVLVYNLG